MKFFVRCSPFVKNAIDTAWKIYWKDENIRVHIYEHYCGELHEANDYETNKTSFYKEFLKKIVNLF